MGSLFGATHFSLERRRLTQRNFDGLWRVPSKGRGEAVRLGREVGGDFSGIVYQAGRNWIGYSNLFIGDLRIDGARSMNEAIRLLEEAEAEWRRQGRLTKPWVGIGRPVGDGATVS